MNFFLLLFSLSISAQTNTYAGWINKSAKFIENNQLDSAAVALQSAMRLEPANENNAVLLLNLGILQRQLRLMDDAYISLTASLGSNPDPVLVLHNRASLLCDLGRFDEAMDDYNSIIKKQPSNVEAYYRRGLLFLEKNDRKDAETDFRTCEGIDSGSLFTRLSKALIFKLDDNWTEAEKIYTDIIKTEMRPNSTYYLNRAECYVNTDRFSKAAADLYAIENEEKENPYFYILRGRLRLDQFDKFAARADFEKAKKLGYDTELADKWIEKAK
ncbi:MAG TPA: tetratricopeptide repeat protein [Petrimonas sp.]|uniref:tetratricopeptide repeat protein n=1 Tax=Petrimonas sp. TaxID=2023866 RepID=UPI001769FCC7|nr:tetratricopeptide repeat protein [Petrimonas sp.]